MKVAIVGPNSSQAFSNHDQTSAQSMLSKFDLEVVPISEQQLDALVCVDIDAPSVRFLSKSEYSGKPKYLIKFEPSVVRPQHSRLDIEEMFSEVFEIGRSKEGQILPWPQTWDERDFSIGLREPKIVAVSANKSSAMKGELYSLRRAAYASIPGVEVYGNGWNEPSVTSIIRWMKEAMLVIRWGKRPILKTSLNVLARPAAYFGPCSDKLETMSNYKVALVIENSQEYMSEKLIDALLAGCIPVYVGPDVREFGIPNELVVQSKADLESVREACEKAIMSDWDSHYAEIRKWKSSVESRKFWTDETFKFIANRLRRNHEN